MANPLLGSLQSDVFKAFNKTLAYNVTLHSVNESEASTGSITESETDISGKGIVVEYSDRMRFEGLVPDGARRAILFQPAFSSAPKLHDRITPSQGPFSGQKMVITQVSEDPAGATWDCTVIPWRP